MDFGSNKIPAVFWVRRKFHHLVELELKMEYQMEYFKVGIYLKGLVEVDLFCGRVASDPSKQPVTAMTCSFKLTSDG